MADCSKTVEYIREMKRMCDNVVLCEICPLRGVAVEDDCLSRISKNPAQAIAVVQKWSDEHPKQTWLGKLREALPNINSTHAICCSCPWDFFGGKAPGEGDCEFGIDYCEVCWNKEYEEETK